MDEASGREGVKKSGFALGIPAALFAGHLMGSQLYGVGSYHPLAPSGATVVLGLCATAAEAAGAALRAIAAETGLHRRYVGRIIQMAFLAPDITEAILEGRQPPHMTLETLMADMPADWAGQRKQLLTSYRPTA